MKSKLRTEGVMKKSAGELLSLIENLKKTQQKTNKWRPKTHDLATRNEDGSMVWF